MSTQDLVTNAGAGGPSIELAISVWLDAKARRSNSRETASAYRETLATFRSALWSLGLDLDTVAPNPRDPHPIALAAQAWAFRRADGITPVAGSTANQRLAILSSFYAFAAKQRLLITPEGLPWPNPIEQVERAKVQAYGGARALSAGLVSERLAAIDRTTLAGKRDYALIALALETGRRATELSNLTFGDLQIDLDHGQITRHAQVTVTWRRTKGGKQMQDKLSEGAATALLSWVSTLVREYRHGTLGAFGALQTSRGVRPTIHVDTNDSGTAGDVGTTTDIGISADANRHSNHPPAAPMQASPNRVDAATPIFVSLSRSSRGHPLTRQALANIWMAHLGTSKVHATRHTFAQGMEAGNATMSEIQARLGHASLDTTGRYLAQLHSAENPHAAALEQLFGITASDEQDLHGAELLTDWLRTAH